MSVRTVQLLEKQQKLLADPDIWYNQDLDKLVEKHRACIDAASKQALTENRLIDKMKNNEKCTESDIIELLTANYNFLMLHEEFINLHRLYKQKIKKFDRIAVLLVGHYRTFPICQPYMINFFNLIADTVDYYFVSWGESDYQTSPIVQSGLDTIKNLRYNEDINLYFGNLLKGVKLVDVNDSPYYFQTSLPLGLYRVINLTYLSVIAQKLKKDYEEKNNFVYDQVIETRPDLLLFRSGSALHKCYNNEVIMSRDIVNPIFHSGNWYWRSTSATNDLLANRYNFFESIIKNSNYQQEYDSFHSVLQSYFLKNQFDLVPAGDGDMIAILSAADIVDRLNKI